MKKKLIVAISIIVLLVGLLFLLSFTVFSLKSVEVNYRTSHTNITATQEEIIEKGEFKKGSSVFFHGKKKYIQKIEQLSPYLKVINIETVFPSNFVIHIAERQEIYAIPFEGGHYICDEQLRVLRIDNAFKNDSTNAILMKLQNPLSEMLQEGDYIKNLVIPPIYEALFENNRTLGEQTEMIEEFSLSCETSSVTGKEQSVATFKLFSGQTVRIINVDEGLVAKVKLMLDVHCQLFEFIGKTLNTQEGEVVLTEQHLKTCIIEINNYLHPSHSEDECYFDIILN